jgi:hypothetical protein
MTVHLYDQHDQALNPKINHVDINSNPLLGSSRGNDVERLRIRKPPIHF